MISVKLDAKGTYQVRWPRTAPEILRLGQTYTAYENSLPVASQLATPSLALMQAAYTAAQTAHVAAASGEAARATAAEALRQTFVAAKPRLEEAVMRLKGNYFTNLAQLEHWGLDTVVNSQGISVRKPKNKREWVAFLESYVTQESQLAPANQVIEPPLSEMMALRTTLQTVLAERTAGRNQREANLQIRTVEADRLLDLLQVAAMALVTVKFNGVVTPDLQNWGFEVTAVTPTEPVKEEETAVEPV